MNTDEMIKKFKRQYHMARKAAESMSQRNISFKISFNQEEGTKIRSELPPEPEIARFATVLRPLVAPASPICYKNIASFIVDNSSIKISESERLKIRTSVQQIERGSIQLNIDGSTFKASEIYQLIAKGEFFSEEKATSESLKAIKKYPPLNPFLLHQFYDYCYDVFNLCGRLFGYIKRIAAAQRNSEATRTSHSPHLEQNPKCIYCLRSDGGFTSEEHVYPESIGNTGDNEVVLPRGCVCDRCNNDVLSKLDKCLIYFEPISFLRLWHVPYTKKGKFPKAQFKNMMIEKTHPRKLVIKHLENSDKDLNVEECEGGVKINLEMLGRSRFNPQLLGRSLYKIGLGMLCWKNGLEIAMDKKYDSARSYILGEQGFPNSLLICYSVEINQSIETIWFLSNPGTPFILNIYGLVFRFNLEETPVLQLTPELEQQDFKSFDLGASGSYDKDHESEKGPGKA